MTNRIVRALEDGAKKIGNSLAEDGAKAVKDFYHSTGDNLKQVARNTAEADAKHAAHLDSIVKDADHAHAPHEPHPGGGESGGHSGEGGTGTGTGRDQAANPREAGRPEDSVCTGGEPVDMATGRMYLDQTDAALPGSLPLLFTRSFESGYRAGRWMGRRWVCTFDERLEIDDQGVVHLRADRITQAYPHPRPGLPVQAGAGERLDLAVDAAERFYTLTQASTGLVREFTTRPDGRSALLTQVRDRFGRTIDYSYDADGTPLALTHSGGYQLLVATEGERITALSLAGAGPDGVDLELVRYGYTDGNPTEVHNSSGLPMRFGYDAEDRIISWTDRNDSHYSYVYDHLGRVRDEGGADGTLRFTFHYGEPDPATGLKVHTETDALGRSTRYQVNQHAQITAQTDALGNTTRFERDQYDRLLSATDPLDRTTRYTYDAAGDLIAVTRPDGEQATAHYEGELGLATEITEPGGGLWRQTYDRVGHRTSLTDPLGATTHYRYDVRGHLAAVTDALGSTTTVRCNPAGLPIEFIDPLGATTRIERDAFGRTTAVTDPLGASTRTTWTLEGRPASRTTPDGATENWTWDGEGNLLAHTDQLGRTTAYEYTHFETLAARTAPDGARTTFTHDPALQLVAVTDPMGRTWDYSYDAAGRLTGESDFHGRQVAYEYDPADQLTTLIDPLRRRTRYCYDDLGRITVKDADSRVTTYAYDPAGRLLRATDPGTDLVRTLDPLGNLLAETSNGRTLTCVRDILGRRVSRTTPAGHTSTWTYDAAGLPVRLTTSGGTLDFTHDAAGHEQTRTIADSLTLTSTWDTQHRLTAQSVSTRRHVLQRRDYSYRADGNLTAVTDQLAGTRRFDLDPVGRVTAVHAPAWTESYAYDRAGNLTDAHWPSTPATRPAEGPRTYTGTQLTTAGRVRYEHDAAGRTTLRQVTRLSRKPDTWHYTWDADDRLTHVTTPDGTRWHYTYDPLGRRTAKLRLGADGSTVTERTDFTWDGAQLAEQTTHAPYLPGPHTLSWDYRGLHPLGQSETVTSSASTDSSSQQQSQQQIDRRFFAIVTDAIGTPAELVDPVTGVIAWRATAALWGTTTWPSDSTTYTPLRFPGQYFDPETRLHYNLNRYYDPETARYATPDPLGLAPAPNPDTYVHNPHTWSDPMGLSPYGSPGGSSTPSGSTPPARPDFVVGPAKYGKNGELLEPGVAVPTSAARFEGGLQGAVDAGEPGFGTFATQSAGKGFDLPDGSSVRIMDPAGSAPRRASFEGPNGQAVSPFTGRQVNAPKGVKGAAARQYIRERTHVELY